MRKKTTSKKDKAPKVSKIQEELSDFETWFWLQTKVGILREWQKSEIKTFFRVKGLKDRETKSKFTEILKLF